MFSNWNKFSFLSKTFCCEKFANFFCQTFLPRLNGPPSQPPPSRKQHRFNGLKIHRLDSLKALYYLINIRPLVCFYLINLKSTLNRLCNFPIFCLLIERLCPNAKLPSDRVWKMFIPMPHSCNVSATTSYKLPKKACFAYLMNLFIHINSMVIKLSKHVSLSSFLMP